MARAGWRIARSALLLGCLLTLAGRRLTRRGQVTSWTRRVRPAAAPPRCRLPLEDYFHDMDGGAA